MVNEDKYIHSFNSARNNNFTAKEQRELFMSWMREQPQIDNPKAKYSPSSIYQIANKLQSGLKSLEVPDYAKINCFTITEPEYFKTIHEACYEKAKEYDKKQKVRDFRNGLDFYLKFLTEQNNPILKKTMEDKRMTVNSQKNNINKNTILYGPPGTGKTYNTVLYAVAIIENKLLGDVKKENYSDVLNRYSKYRTEGLIEFTTFHQSYGYEEFIEGIKPVITYNTNGDNTDSISYKVLPGTFKAFCDKANPQTSSFDDIWNKLIEKVYENNGQYTFTRRTGSTVQAELRDDDTFIVKWNSDKGSSNSLKKERIYKQWLADDYSSREKLSGGTKWGFDAMQAIIDTMVKKFGLVHSGEASAKKNYVFIIDEINRGNISKIFGELITLIEDSKRLGKPEGMKAKLPYSQELFGVPDNIYIIGTMNTADRSIATIDTALRLRFYFKEMMPDTDVLKGITVEDISVSEMLSGMNKKISVLYDREHTIGHAYFIPLRKNPTIEQLADIFENAIIPLLQEYFYEDYEKIRLVLGDNNKENTEDQFIIAVANDYNELFGSTDIGFDDSVTYEINHSAFGNIEAYHSI